MPQRKGKKILIYFFLLLLVGSINNDTINSFKFENIKNINVLGLGHSDNQVLLYKIIDLNLGEDYILEVSTPGVDRKFFDINQLKAYVGEELELKTREIHEGKRKFSGKLLSCDDLCLVINSKSDSNGMKFKFSDIDLCKLKPNYNNLIKEYSYGK